MYPIGCSKTETQYSFTNKPLKIVRSSAHGPSTHTLTYTYDYYESNDKPKKVTLKYDYQPSIDMAEYEYNSLGQLKKLKRGGMDNATYSYDIQGHLTDITNPKFTENLLYANGGLFNGNIAYSFSTIEGSVPHLYHYGYDGLNRLTSASYSNAISNDRDFYNENATYDANGNILSLQRNGLKDDGTYGGIDNLTYSYAGNQVVRISDAVSGPNYAGAFHFIDNNDSYYEYAYDRNGNMTLDFNRKISQIEYNFLNLPKNVTMRNNAGYMSYTYDALGTKLRKAYLVYGTNGTEGGYYDYMGEFVYNGTTLEQVRFDGGYISFAANGLPQYHYYHQDHLGNIRTVTDAGGQVEQRRSYYPFGTSFKESATTDDNRLKFSGKELERLHGLNDYDFGARTYVPTIGRFTQIDPLCEKYYHVSPYVYCENNPIWFVDKNGMEPGDYFKTRNAAAIDFGIYYNPRSIKENVEYGSYIMYDPKRKQYYYPRAYYGSSNRISRDGSISVPKGHRVSAIIHTHAAHNMELVKDGIDWNDNFSGMESSPKKNLVHKPDSWYDDITTANQEGYVSYVVTPNGNLKMYEPSTGEIFVVSNEMPSDEKAGQYLANDKTVDLRSFLDKILDYIGSLF